ncbi:MAG: glycosyl hydrolase [Verrucomicrobiota bacterium]
MSCFPMLAVILSCAALAVPQAAAAEAQAFGEADAAAFATPALAYHPQTWFHFIGGNVATKGITADLEAIAGAGISGVQLFHGQFGTPWPGVDPQIQCLSPAWDNAVNHAAKESKRLGLEFTMQNCPGWAMSGGPWISPQNAMRNLVWSRSDVSAAGTDTIALPKPQPSGEDWRDYREVAVIAFPTPEGDTGKPLVPVNVTSNRRDLPWEKSLGAPDGAAIHLDPNSNGTWVEATFADEITLRSVQFPSIQKFNHQWSYEPGVTVKVEAVRDGKLQVVADYTMPQSSWTDDQPMSLACREVPAKTYRITIVNQHPMDFPYLRLFSAARKHNWEFEAGWTLRSLDRSAYPQQSQPAWLDQARLLDLTSKLDSSGNLHWKVPAGHWTILRWGHVNTGARNGPAPPEGTGWECNKLSTIGADAHFPGYIGRIASPGGPGAGGLLKGMVMDSWECGVQTWTAEMDKEFLRLRGYPLRSWLPALAGYVVASPETTQRFLRDWRATLNDLLVTNFYGRMAAQAHAKGLKVSYETAVGDVITGDILEYYKFADVPMCEFWQPRMENFVGSFNFKPVKPCVSAARMYGKRRVAAEAFTSMNLTWAEHPGMLKHIANMHLAEGITQLVFHTYTHAPRTDWLPPGSTFGAGIGTPFLRGQTWWKHMPEFTGYLSRCEYMLERGNPVSDVLWYLGDELDHKPLETAPFPAGYRHDYCNTDALLHRISVRDGRWLTPEGISYGMLWLPDCPRLLPETLEHLLALVKQGGILVGERPLGLATLSGGSQAESRFRTAADALWGQQAALGKGRVISGKSIADALKLLAIGPDVEGRGVVWNHRQAEGADWYFVAAPEAGGFHGNLRFRAGGEVRLWDPATGTSKPAGMLCRDGATTTVALDLAPSEAVFVMFRSAGENPSSKIASVVHGGVKVAQMQAAADNQKRVLSAAYGDPANASRRKDVLGIVREELAQGASVLHANNPWAGGDPALGTRKKLFVELQLPDGGRKQLEAWENEPLRVVDDAMQLAVCEVLDGKSLLAWQPGEYQITRDNGRSATVSATLPKQVALEKSWTLTFPPGWGATAPVALDHLGSWTEPNIPEEARAFSGTAVYTTQFALETIAKDCRVELDLGRVEVIASVRVNGRLLRTLWAPPFKLDVTSALKPGTNQLAVEVTNTWRNRLAYDSAHPEPQRKTWTVSGPGPVPLIPAGLLGPVTLRIGQTLELPESP